MTAVKRITEKIRRAYRWGKEIGGLFSAHRITTIAGALAFFLILSLVPLCFWLILLFGKTGVTAEDLLSFELFGWARELLLYLSEHAEGAVSGAGIFLVVTTLWSGSAFFYHLRRSGELLYGLSRPHKGVRMRLGAIFFTFGVLLFFAAAAGILFLLKRANRFLPMPLQPLLTGSVLLALGFSAALLLNRYVCPVRRPASASIKGSLLTAILWLGAAVIFLVYSRFSSKEKLYGALSLVIVFFLFLYWMMICFAAGVVVNKKWGLTNGRKGSKIERNECLEEFMTKVNDLPYSRVTLEETQAAFERFFAAVGDAKNADEVLAARRELIANRNKFDTAYCLANIRFTQNTADPFYKGEMDYYDEVYPLIHNELAKYYRVMLESPFRKELEATLGSVLFAGFECAVKAHSEAIVEDEQQENALTTEYSQLMAGMLFDWQGEKIPLTVLRGKLEDPDPAVRKAAADAIGLGLQANKQKLDEIYDKLVHIRDRMAKKMGYKNYVELGYYRMGRTGYTRDMVEHFRANVRESLVPVVSALKERIREEMGLDEFRFSDNEVYTKEGNPPFTLTIPEAFHEASQMYHEMDAGIGAFFDSMTEAGALDVESRHNKAGGGYCTFIGEYHQPFIFANFNGTTADADVLTHEFGHAFAAHCIDVGGVDYDIDVGGMETAECHSMSMEFLCWPYMKRFFKEREQGYRYKHLADALSFIPYGCIVDEFQHLVYEHPDWTPEERDKAYLELEKTYRPYLTYAGIPYLEEGTRWQYQAHIFESPFYYIDYCLAQTVAFGFLVLSQEDHDEALRRYKQFVSAGGTIPFRDLVKRAGLADPFGEGTLGSLAASVSEILKKVKPQ